MAVAKKKTKVKPGTSKEQTARRRVKFVENYISNGGNGAEAAKDAGFSDKTAYSQASRMLKDVKVIALIRERQDELANRHRLTTESVIAELSKIVHADLRRMFDANGNLLAPSEWPDDLAGAIAGVDVITTGGEIEVTTKKIKLWDKNSAIEKAMKHLGLFEQDNKQKNLLDGLPRELVKEIAARLRTK